MTYDEWKLMDGSEELRPAGDECYECGQEHHDQRIWSAGAGYHLCTCLDCMEGRREFDYDREHEE